MKITPDDLKTILQKTSDEIVNFTEEVSSKPDDFGHQDTDVLLQAIKESQQALLDYESQDFIGNRWVDVDPRLTKRILSAISSILEKRAGESAGSLQIALNSLIEFQNDIRDIERRRQKEKEMKFKAKKVEQDIL